ncbi:MAG: hypothetical protein HY862_05645 [Chloroflexi bacterium]|nr:hypothetical protein [Chloroflexota bacterium]
MSPALSRILIVLIPEQEHRQFIQALTEYIIEGYYAERGFTVAYAYVMHKALTHNWRPTLWPTIVTTLI